MSITGRNQVHPEVQVQTRYFQTRVWIACQAALLCCGIFLLSSVVASAQIAGTGNIQGTVTDTTGAVIVDSTVTITNEATHVKHTTKTSQGGIYLFPGLPVGTYDLTATARGFTG